MSDKTQDIAYFLAFCVEQYKNEKHISGEEAMRRLDRHSVLDYLAEHFDVLHTQSRQWILADIEEYINIRKEEEHETVSR